MCFYGILLNGRWVVRLDEKIGEKGGVGSDGGWTLLGSKERDWSSAKVA